MTGEPEPQVFRYRVDTVTVVHSDEGQAFLNAFGLMLKLERVKRGMNQDEFGELIGMHRTFVGQLERGQRGINIRELPRIARGLGIEPAALLP